MFRIISKLCMLIARGISLSRSFPLFLLFLKFKFLICFSKCSLLRERFSIQQLWYSQRMIGNICGRLLGKKRARVSRFIRIPLETHLSCEVLKVENDEEPAASNGLRARKAHANARDRAQKCEQGAARYKRRNVSSAGARENDEERAEAKART